MNIREVFKILCDTPKIVMNDVEISVLLDKETTIVNIVDLIEQVKSKVNELEKGRNK